MSDDIKELSAETPQPTENDKPENPQDIFEQRYELLLGDFSRLCEERQLPLAIAVVVDPECPQQPFMYMTGHEYDLAVLLTKLLRKIKPELIKALEV